MGACFSDVRGGQQAVGGAQRRSQATEDGDGGGHNDAVEFFYRNKGVQPLCAQIEVYYTRIYIYIYIYYLYKHRTTSPPLCLQWQPQKP